MTRSTWRFRRAPMADDIAERPIVDPPMRTDEAKVEAAMLALPLLVERLGGVVEITEAELEALGIRHGGLRNVGVQIEKISGGLRFTIVHVEREPLS
jgi:hypothetical protein